MQKMTRTRKVLVPHFLTTSLCCIGTSLTSLQETEAAPAAKKRKTGATTSVKKAGPDEAEDDDNDVPEDDGVEDEADSAEEDDAVENTDGPAAAAKANKEGAVPKEDDLKEVDDVIAADEANE